MKIRRWNVAILGVFAVLAGTVCTPTTGFARTGGQAVKHDGKVTVQVGPAQKMLNASQAGNSKSSTTMLGPVQYIDSLFTDHCSRVRLIIHRHHHREVRHRRRCFGLMSAASSYAYDMSPVTGALSNERVIMGSGKVGSVNQCGVHPIGAIQQDPNHPFHLWTLYHAEQAWPGDRPLCIHVNHHTRWTIRRMYSYNNGQTWHDGGKVIGQDTNLLTDPVTGVWNFLCDDTGSPHMVQQDGYLYVFYKACNEAAPVRRMSMARAPVSSFGVPGSWQKWYNGDWSQPGLGGQQSSIDSLPAPARGIIWDTYLHSYIAVLVNITGGYLYQSNGQDLMHWTPLATMWQTGLTGSVWGHHCHPSIGEPAAYGYGSPIGLHYSPSSGGQSFWVYYMHKPAGKCMDSRLLVRRQITLN